MTYHRRPDDQRQTMLDEMLYLSALEKTDDITPIAFEAFVNARVRRLLACDDPFDQWMTALAFVKPGQRLFVDRGGSKWYANIRHEKGYVVWYMPGASPAEALSELARALEERGEPKYEVLGEWQRVEA